ncbi:MAG: hypothetical protein ACR2NX_02560 [Chthoniobacterales bacterium]
MGIAADRDGLHCARQFQLQPLAGFSIEARVLHRKNYHFDTSAELAPTDLALGWGRMSDQVVLDRLQISQSMRFYWYEYRNPPPIPKDEIIRHSSNMHIIAATREIERECASLHEGELVRLEGELVEATGEGIRPWRSSLRRDDSGNGACELFFVQRFSRIAH